MLLNAVDHQGLVLVEWDYLEGLLSFFDCFFSGYQIARRVASA